MARHQYKTKSARRNYMSAEGTPAAMNSFDGWARCVDEKAGALEQAMESADWHAVRMLAGEFSTLLRAAPRADAHRVQTQFKSAQHLIERVRSAAIETRDATRSEIKRIVKGRKAVSAYR